MRRSDFTVSEHRQHAKTLDNDCGRCTGRKSPALSGTKYRAHESERFQDQEVQIPHAEFCQTCTRKHALVLSSTGDTFRKAYLEGCQRVGDGPKCGPNEDQKQTGSNIKEHQGHLRSESDDTLFVSIFSTARSMSRLVCLSWEYGGCNNSRIQESKAPNLLV